MIPYGTWTSPLWPSTAVPSTCAFLHCDHQWHRESHLLAYATGRVAKYLVSMLTRKPDGPEYQCSLGLLGAIPGLHLATADCDNTGSQCHLRLFDATWSLPKLPLATGETDDTGSRRCLRRHGHLGLPLPTVILAMVVVNAT